MKTLYELTAEQEELYELLSTGEGVDEDGQLRPELAALLAVNEKNIKTKALSYALVIKQLRSEAAAIKAERQALDERQKRRDKNADRLEGFIEQALINAGLTDKLSDPRAEIKFTKSTRLEILDEDSIPEEYFKIKREANKDLIKREIKSGKEIVGAEIREYKNISIK